MALTQARLDAWLRWNEHLIGWHKIRLQLAVRAPLGAAEDWPKKA